MQIATIEHIKVNKSYKEKTAFTFRHELYKFLRLRFVSKNVPVTYQRVVDIILYFSKLQFLLIYLDNIVLFSGTRRLHLHHTRGVLRFLKEPGVTLNLKCTLVTNKIDYFGNVVGSGRNEVASHSTVFIRDSKIQVTENIIYYFIGFL